MRKLSRETAKTISDTKTIAFPGHDIEVTIKSLSGADYMTIKELLNAKYESDDAKESALEIAVLAMSIVNEDGKLEFDNEEGKQDLAGLKVGIRRVIAKEIFDFNGMPTGQPDSAKKNVTTKNSQS